MIERRVPFQVGQDRFERVASIELVGSKGEDEQHAGPDQSSSEERDHIQGRPVGPVQVVDDRDDVALRRGCSEQIADAQEGGSSTRGWGGDVVRLVGDGGATEGAAKAGGFGFDGGAQVAGSIQQLDDREVGQASTHVDAGATQDHHGPAGRRFIVDRSHEFSHQSTLADPGLAG